MKHENTLKANVLVSQLADMAQNKTHDFLDNSVVAVC
jgi:hypothetical protein